MHYGVCKEIGWPCYVCRRREDAYFQAVGNGPRLVQNLLSEVGFEPTPTFVDQNTRYTCIQASSALESGALDHSAILTYRRGGVEASKPFPPTHTCPRLKLLGSGGIRTHAPEETGA